MGGSVLYSALTAKWFVQIYWRGKKCRLWKLDGRPLTERAAAEQLLARVCHDITELGDSFNPAWYQKNAPTLLVRYMEEWLAGSSACDNTQKTYRICMARVIEHLGDSCDIRDLNASSLSKLYVWLKKQMSVKGAYNCMSTLRTLLNQAFRDEVIRRVPPFPRMSLGLPEKIPYLTTEQQTRVLSFIKEEHRPVFEFGMEYGLRTEELRALQKDVIKPTTDFPNGEVIIKRSWASRSELRETTKTGETRSFGLTTRGKEILGRARKGFSHWVFTYDGTSPYTHRQLSNLWERACKKAGIKMKLYNGLRHSLGGQLLDEGYGLDVVQDALGHKAQSTTRRYAKRSPAAVTKILENRVISFRSPTCLHVSDTPQLST